jgi:hypothetical protein
MSNPIRLRQAPERTGNRRDALDNGGPRRRDFALLEGDHRRRRKSVEQFAGAEQEIGVVRAPEPLVAARKGLVKPLSSKSRDADRCPRRGRVPGRRL